MTTLHHEPRALPASPVLHLLHYTQTCRGSHYQSLANVAPSKHHEGPDVIKFIAKIYELGKCIIKYNNFLNLASYLISFVLTLIHRTSRQYPACLASCGEGVHSLNTL